MYKPKNPPKAGFIFSVEKTLLRAVMPEQAAQQKQKIFLQLFS